MKTSTKFFILTAAINMTLSMMIAMTTLLKEVRTVDLMTFYATAFGAGASFAAMIVSIRGGKKGGEIGP